jgi:hypothetical protein
MSKILSLQGQVFCRNSPSPLPFVSIRAISVWSHPGFRNASSKISLAPAGQRDTIPKEITRSERTHLDRMIEYYE